MGRCTRVERERETERETGTKREGERDRQRGRGREEREECREFASDTRKLPPQPYFVFACSFLLRSWIVFLFPR